VDRLDGQAASGVSGGAAASTTTSAKSGALALNVPHSGALAVVSVPVLVSSVFALLV
jgi:hypothetical protein